MMMNRKARRRTEALQRKAHQKASGRLSAALGSGHLRAALLGTAAAGAMMIAQPNTAHAQAVVLAPGTGACVQVGTTATCTGDLVGGIDADGPAINTLNVNTLTGNITPANNVDGIDFETPDGRDITINSDTGPFGIVTTGAGDGIYAYVNGNGDITINSVGNITAGDDGIDADVDGDGNISIVSIGNIAAADDGFYAYTDGGNVTIMSTGNITTDDRGIYAGKDGAGDTTVISTGNITSGGIGIDVDNEGTGNTTIVSMGHISAMGYGGHGVYGYAEVGNVTITSTGNVTTTGDGAFGLYAQVEEEGVITITSTGNITTNGEDSFGIFAYVDDGAGPASVTVMSTGNITTSGDDADGILAFVDDPDAPASVTVVSTGNIATAGDDAHGIFAYVDDPTVPGSSVSVMSTGNITTTGDNAIGIYAYVDNGPGDVTVTSVGNITTSGDEAHAIYGYVEAGGAGSVSTVTSTGNITVNGNDADGIRNNAYDDGDMAVVNILGGTVQGGSGLGSGVNFNGNAGSMGTLNISNGATVSALSGTAVLGGAGNETVNNSGTVVGAVNLGMGADTVNLNAAGTTTAATFDGGGGIGFDSLRLSGPGTNTLDGAQHINFEFLTVNGGRWTLTGMHTVPITAGVFGNGTLDLAGEIVSPTVRNLIGTITTGGMDTIGTGTITGNFVQGDLSTFAPDVDLGAGTSDLLVISGTADLNGTVAPNLAINPVPGTEQVTILTAAGGVTNNGLGLAPTSPIIATDLLFPNPTDVALGITIDFTPPGSNLNQNQTNIANNLSASLAAGGGGLDPILDVLLFGIDGLDDYTDALDQLSPEVVLNSETAALFGAEEFANNFFSCRSGGVEHAFIKEGQCVWLRAEGRFLERDRTSSNIGFDEDSASITLGGQFNVAPNWFVGGGIGYEYSDLDTNTNASVEADTFQAGGVVKYQSGPLLAAAALAGGISDHESRRRVNFGGFGATAKSSYDSHYVAAQLRAAYLLEQGRFFVKPQVDVNITYIDRDGTTETGGGAANLRVSGSDDTYFSVTPSVAFGTEFTTANGAIFQPFAKVGVALYEDDSQSVTANFVSAPAGVPSFTVSSEFDDVFGEVEAGVSVFHAAHGLSLSVSYEGRFSSDTQQHGGAVKGTVKF